MSDQRDSEWDNFSNSDLVDGINSLKRNLDRTDLAKGAWMQVADALFEAQQEQLRRKENVR